MPTSAKSARCTNPRCHCTPCVCTECRCNAPRLGDLERRVMHVMWAHQGAELTAREVSDELADHAYTTVATVLDRLARKGEVRRFEGRVLRFSATGSSGTHAARVLRDALDAADDPIDALRSLGRVLSADEAEVLRESLRHEPT